MTAKDKRYWKQFRLIMTDPPSFSRHFEFVQMNLIPFIERLGVRFWVTNYRNPKAVYITFRVEVNDKEYELTEQFLNNLVDHDKIVRWIPKDWNPENDARKRIESACQKLKLPPELAGRFKSDERIEQLTLLFTDAVGSCTKALYKSLKSKPDEPWMMSLFIHLILNSIDLSGPDP